MNTQPNKKHFTPIFQMSATARHGQTRADTTDSPHFPSPNNSQDLLTLYRSFMSRVVCVPALVGLTSLLIQNHKPSDFISCDVMHQLLFPVRRRLVSAAAQCRLVTQSSGFTLAPSLTHIPSSLHSFSTLLTLTMRDFFASLFIFS